MKVDIIELTTAAGGPNCAAGAADTGRAGVTPIRKPNSTVEI